MEGYNKFQPDTSLNEFLESLAPNPDSPCLAPISPDDLKSSFGDLSSLNFLSLFGSKIENLSCLKDLSQLIILDLSCNSIQEIKGLESLTQLTRLDLHSNYIRICLNLQNQQKLTKLDISNNLIADWEQVENLRGMLPELKELTICCNPIASKLSYRAIMYSHMHFLTLLDGEPYTQADKNRVEVDYKLLDTPVILEALKSQNKGVLESNDVTENSFDESVSGKEG